MRKNCSLIFGVDLRPCALAVQLVAALAMLFVHAVPASAQNSPVTIAVDANANRRPIDPNIYGVAHASTAELNDLNSPLNRNGGNNTTRYNWQLNADNRGNDWYYESIADGSATAGERGDTFFSNARAANAQAMLTIPTIEWVAKVGSNRSKLASFSVARYGAQTGTDWQWFPDAGNGVRTNGQFVSRQRSERRERALDVHVSAGVGPASRRPVGHERERWPALLHPRQRAEPLALDAPRRPPDVADDERD